MPARLCVKNIIINDNKQSVRLAPTVVMIQAMIVSLVLLNDAFCSSIGFIILVKFAFKLVKQYKYDNNPLLNYSNIL